MKEFSQEDPGANTGGTSITWTVEKTQALEAAYHAAVEAGEDQFVHGGHTFVTQYAMYLIQYLAVEFSRRGLWPTTGA